MAIKPFFCRQTCYHKWSKNVTNQKVIQT